MKGQVLYKFDFQNLMIVALIGRGLSCVHPICIHYKTTQCFENISID